MKKLMKRLLGAVLALALVGAAAPVSAEAATVVSQAAYSVTVQSALIQGGSIVVSTASSAVPATDDGMYYLYAQETYQSGTQGMLVGANAAGRSVSFSVPLNFDTASSNLFKKFVVAVKRNGTMMQVSNACYVTNPEAVARHTTARIWNGSKKGILPESSLIDKEGNLRDLGISQITYNLPIGNLLTGGGITYNYNGKVYNFNAAIAGQYDYLVPKMNAMGISVTLIILNNRVANAAYLHPFSRDSLSSNYYAFNTAEQVGVETLEAVAAFLGERYSGTGHGTVDNWIIGNEVNARHEWNYISASLGVDGAAAEYAKALRIFYNGIKSQNANARVFASFDHEWAASDNVALHYGAKSFMTSMNNYIAAEGNFGWDVAVHPYNVPLYLAQTWAPSNHVTHTQDSRYITMANIEIFTDYMCQPLLRKADGSVRRVLCSEVGYTSLAAMNSSEMVQGAALVYGFLQCQKNQYIDGFFPREMDHASEIAQGMAFGVLNADYSKKLSYNYYKFVDKASAAEYINAASSVIGMDINLLLTPR